MNIKKPLSVTACCFFLFVLPIVSAFRLSPRPPGSILLFYAALGLVAFVSVRRHGLLYSKRDRETDALEEKANVQSDNNEHERATQRSLREKIKRYSALCKIIEELNASVTVDVAADHLVSAVFSLIAYGKGVCVLFLLDKASQTLGLCKAKKEDRSLVIKAKQGDIFDYWVMRHASPLLVEDLSKDFRFDREKLSPGDTRAVASLISSPFTSGTSLLGVLRLDYHEPNFFNQEDLRFLMTVADLGAVALENGELYRHAEDLATHDGLTGLFGKGHFMELLSGECRTALRHGRPLGLLMVDIDLFKKYNDTFGHAAGDIVLQALSSTLRESLKGDDATISRFGGEEFCIMLPAKTRHESVEIAERLRRGIEGMRLNLRRQESVVTVSIGVAALPEEARDETDLVMKADKAMYAAKRAGRNRVCTSDQKQ
ncbi:MAG: sensor domain-containing diguanylate cyclase [Candidatus Omnitrophica bacterium]|nr:sensor domain-containing diguanylate cyclase [Candidatus Omnitrophota bacterium]